MLSDILKYNEFQNFASMIRVPFHSEVWRNTHQQVPFWNLISDFEKKTPPDGDWNKPQVIESFTNLITSISEASINDIIPLTYSPDDYNWFIETLDSKNHKVTICMLRAYYSAPEPTLSIKQVSKLTNKSPATWKNYCADGLVPATKLDGSWQIPRSIIDNYNKTRGGQ